MKGFMRRRGDAWELRVYLGTDPVTGKQRYATRSVRGGKREAQRTLNAMVNDAERGLLVRTNATVGELLEASFEHAAGVIEFDRPTRKTTDGAKSDTLDAIRAAREMLGRQRLSVPRAHDGVREAIRVHAVTRAGAVRARTGAINELKAMIVTADEALRVQLRGLRTPAQVDVCAKLRDQPSRAVDQRCTRQAMRALARRIQHLDAEVDDHDRVLRQLLDEATDR